MAALRILTTGGTFDKTYSQITERLGFARTHVQEILKIGRNRNGVKIENLMAVDSLYMTDADRQGILKRCQSCRETMILITHGTGTMVETAKVLSKVEDKTIVLTGAMVPYTIRGSDAVFNFAFAYCAALTLPAGVYIAMNGRIFNWGGVRKNTATGEFEQFKSH